MQDDRFYQQATEYIFPSPLITTDTFKHNIKGIENEFCYILIDRDNMDRIYEISKDYFHRKDKNQYSLEQALPKIVIASTTWIRRDTI